MKQSRMEEILRDYTAGKLDAQQANQELKKMGAPVRLQPGRNEITEAEQQATRVGDTPDQAEGYGLLDTGTGSMEKVHVHRGRLEHAVNQVQLDGTVNMLAYAVSYTHLTLPTTERV